MWNLFLSPFGLFVLVSFAPSPGATSPNFSALSVNSWKLSRTIYPLTLPTLHLSDLAKCIELTIKRRLVSPSSFQSKSEKPTPPAIKSLPPQKEKKKKKKINTFLKIQTEPLIKKSKTRKSHLCFNVLNHVANTPSGYNVSVTLISHHDYTNRGTFSINHRVYFIPGEKRRYKTSVFWAKRSP